MNEVHHPTVHPPLNETDVPHARAMLDDSPVEQTTALMELLQNPETSRVALYLPWHLLPATDSLEYREIYLDAWWSLLEQVDQRADFTDGDIGERNDGQPRPMVAKAAHLAPMLKRAGLISSSELEYIRDGTDSDILAQSIDDAPRTGMRASLHATPSTIHEQLAFVKRRSEHAGDTPARARWQHEAAVRNLTRVAARNLTFGETEQLTDSEDPLITIIALRALARLGRRGHDVFDLSLWMLDRTKHGDQTVRQQANASLRHLHYAGLLPRDLLELNGVSLPQLSGELSQNTHLMSEKIGKLTSIAEKLTHDPLLNEIYYPAVLVGGSRIKGYGDEHSDIDTTVLVRPGATGSKQLMRELFGNDTPLELPLEQTPGGLRMKNTELTSDTWSHLVYSTIWIGDDATVDMLRRELTTTYDDPTLRFGALRRLEQDSLQYRLMHKGYEQHHAVESDDFALPSGGINRDSTFWDPGYRELATKLFVEKVRLPKVK